MKEINLVSDGSYKTCIIGLGWVEIQSGNQIMDVKSVRLESRALDLRRGSTIAEFCAATFALNHIKAPSNIAIHVDNNELYQWLNGEDTISSGENIDEVKSQLQHAIHQHVRVKAFHRDDPANPIPRYAFAIAHNASATASGAIKREITLPYEGEFHSAIHVSSNHRERSEERERLRRYGFA